MALNFLAGGANGSSSSAKLFDIRLDNDYILLRGNEDEAASAQVQGSLVLCLTEPLTIKHIKLTLSGINRMSWHVTAASTLSGRRVAYKERTFFEKSWIFRDPGKTKTEVLKPDNYEFPFDTIIQGSMPESVEGMENSWVIYRFKAEIGRKYAKDLVIRKPLRIVRTLGPSALELSHGMSVENVWVNKIEYTISTPTKAIVFGTSLQVDFRLIPLLKGLTIGLISTQIKEEQEFVLDPEFNVSACNVAQKHERIIAHDEYLIGPDADPEILDEAAEGYSFSRFLELPKSLNRCLQDCHVKGIKVRHKLKFIVQLHNPDGHTSELRANLPVSFYISPSLPIDENNDLVDQSPHATRSALGRDVGESAPPLYGEHHLDQLYSDVDLSGYRTPGNFSTPGTPTSVSRSISSENLTALGTITNGISTSPSGHQVSPAALRNRLQNLGFGGAAIPQSHLANEDRSPENLDSTTTEITRRVSPLAQNDYFLAHSPSGQHSTSHSPTHLPNGISGADDSQEVSRRSSAEDQPQGSTSGNQTPRPQFYHAESPTLSRVPSYQTAVRTPARRGAESIAGLPSYSITTAESFRVPVEPPSVYVRDRHNGREPPSQANRALEALQDEERRFRVMQARGR